MTEITMLHNTLVTLLICAFGLGIGLGGLIVAVYHRVKYRGAIEHYNYFTRGLRKST